MGSGSFSISGSGSGSGSSLVLDGERGELVRAPAVRIGKKGGGKGGLLDEKAMIALRNHSEAERRRRERINSHLSVLRGMISGTEKVFSHFLSLFIYGMVLEVHILPHYCTNQDRSCVLRFVLARISMHINGCEL